MLLPPISKDKGVFGASNFLNVALLQGIAALVLALSPPSAWGADQRYSLGLGFEFATGDYGTGETTDSYRIPLFLNYYPTDRIDLSLEIPYIYQSSRTTVPLGGMRFPHSGGGGMMTGNDGGGMMGHNMNSGLGDATLTAGYIALRENAGFPLVRPIAYVKFPTADKDRGFGTGEFDLGGGLSLAKWYENWSTYLEGMYVVTGSSSAFDPDNYWTYRGSLSYRFTERLRSGIALSGATAPFPGAPDALEAKARVNYWTSGSASIGGYVSRGLSKGSADYGLGAFAAVSW